MEKEEEWMWKMKLPCAVVRTLIQIFVKIYFNLNNYMTILIFLAYISQLYLKDYSCLRGIYSFLRVH